MARPRSAKGNDWTTMASAAGNIRAAPRPWRARKVMSHHSAAPPIGVRPFMAEAAANTTVPSSTIFLWPTMSPRRPPKANRAARESR